jgi:hypothetical protein
MDFAGIQSLIVCCPALILWMGCEHHQIEVSIPRITKIAAPQSVELPNAVNLTCEVENPESFDLQFDWESSAGTIQGNSSSVIFFTPSVRSEVTITCSISDSIRAFDKKSVQISVVLPPFVGNYVLKSLRACDSTYTTDNSSSPNLILEIYDTAVSGKGFAYSWKVSHLGLPTPEGCYPQMPDKTHNGFMGKWLYG